MCIISSEFLDAPSIGKLSVKFSEVPFAAAARM